MAEQVIDAEFGAPMARLAYKPGDKGTSKGIFYMTIFGAIAALVLGFAFTIGGLFVSEFVAERGVIGFLVGMAMIFIMFPFLGGMLMGWVIGRGSLIGKSHSLRVINMAAIFCSVATFCVYALIRIVHLEGDAFNSIIDLLKIVIPALIFWGVTYSMAEGQILSKPFCEKCNNYMLIKRSQKFNREKQVKLLALTSISKNSELLKECFSMEGAVTDNTLEPYAIAECFYCKTCNSNGFLNIHSYIIKQIHSGNKIENSTRNQLVYSTVLNAEEIAQVIK